MLRNENIKLLNSDSGYVGNGKEDTENLTLLIKKQNLKLNIKNIWEAKSVRVYENIYWRVLNIISWLNI